MVDYKALIDNAREAARLATVGAVDGYPCGFAYVAIKPARGPFIKFLKDNKIGRIDSYNGGWWISSYDVHEWNGQNMYVKAKACSAFAKVLNDAGIAASVREMID